MSIFSSNNPYNDRKDDFTGITEIGGARLNGSGKQFDGEGDMYILHTSNYSFMFPYISGWCFLRILDEWHIYSEKGSSSERQCSIYLGVAIVLILSGHQIHSRSTMIIMLIEYL